MFFIYAILTLIGLHVWQILMRRIHRLPPGPFKIPVFGNLVQIWIADQKYHYKGLYELSKKYGKIITSDIGVVRAVTVSGFEAIKTVYSNDDFLDRMDPEWLLHRSFGKKIGLINGSSAHWIPTRKFTMKYLRDFGFGKRNIQQTLLEQEMAELSQIIDEIISKSGGVLEPCSIFQLTALNTIWASVSNSRFSRNDPAVKKVLSLLSEYAENALILEGAPTAYPCLTKWFPNLFSKKLFDVDDEFHAFFRELVARIRQQHEDTEEPSCFLEAYLSRMKIEQLLENSDSKQIFTEETLITILYDLFGAGSHTTSEAMRFAIFWLTLYPECQEKIRSEIENEIGKKEFVPFEDKGSLPYTQAFILETLRRGVLVPLFGRKVFKATPLDNFIIPANTAVILNYYSVVMDDEFWGDPQNFRPSRFLDDHNNIINSERVLIFGGGKRDCIGRNIAQHTMFAVITFLIRKYKFLPLNAGYPYNVNNLKPGTLIGLAKYGIRVQKLEK